MLRAIFLNRPNEESNGKTRKQSRGRLLEDDTGWSPYISVEDAFKLDDVRDALRHGDLKSAASHGQIYELRRVSPSLMA